MKQAGILRLFFLGAAVSTLPLNDSSAQTFTASIVGTIKDATGGLVPGVTVTAANAKVHLENPMKQLPLLSIVGIMVLTASGSWTRLVRRSPASAKEKNCSSRSRSNITTAAVSSGGWYWIGNKLGGLKCERLLSARRKKN